MLLLVSEEYNRFTIGTLKAVSITLKKLLLSIVALEDTGFICLTPRVNSCLTSKCIFTQKEDCRFHHLSLTLKLL